MRIGANSTVVSAACDQMSEIGRSLSRSTHAKTVLNGTRLIHAMITTVAQPD